MKTYYLDIETTGLSADRDYIVEIAIVGDELKEGWLVKPPIDIPTSATAIHSITPAIVAQSPPISEILGQIKGILGESCYLVAHNGDCFDKKFVVAEAKRHGISLPDGWIWIDSLKWARKYRPDLRSHRLGALVEACNCKLPAAEHRALDDTLALKRVCEHMWGDLTTEQIKNLLYDQPVNKIFPWGKWAGCPIQHLPRDYASWVVNKSGAEQTLKDDIVKIIFKR